MFDSQNLCWWVTVVVSVPGHQIPSFDLLEHLAPTWYTDTKELYSATKKNTVMVYVETTLEVEIDCPRELAGSQSSSKSETLKL